MKKLLVLMLAMLTAVTSPEQFKMHSICPRQYRLCFISCIIIPDSRFLKVSRLFIEIPQFTADFRTAVPRDHLGSILEKCHSSSPQSGGRRAVRRAFKHRANHWYNESASTEDDERTASAFRIGHRAGTAVLPPCSTPQQLTEHQNKNTRRGTAGAFILVELTGVEPVSEKKAVRVSPGAVHLLKFPQCERVHTLDTLVAS